MCTDKLRTIEDYLSQFKLDDSLLFLNHLLGVTRGYTCDEDLLNKIVGPKVPVLPHHVHLIAKLLMLNASNLGAYPMNWEGFQFVRGMCIDLDDPIVNDPNWINSDPSGLFERLLSQQLGPQYRMPLQKYGLALGLFRDVGIIEYPQHYDLRRELEAELGISVEQFMGLGHVAFGLNRANQGGIPCTGTFTKEYLTDAFIQGLAFCVPELWGPFLERVACNREKFRELSNLPEYVVEDAIHSQFSFNPFRRYPIVDLGQNRFLAPDPELVIDRVTLGLFYDLFEAKRTNFSRNFGFAFEKFVGSLIACAGRPDQTWSASDWEQKQIGKKQKQKQKVSDWAFKGDHYTVLFECKSLRPSLELTTYGSTESIDSLRGRLKSALVQLTRHATDINNGNWEQEGLKNASMLGVIVTYGKFYAINAQFAKRRIREELNTEGTLPIPFVVLSLNELDTVLRLVELGHPLDEIILNMASNELLFDPLAPFDAELKDNAISSATLVRGKEFLERVITGALAERV